ncbi:hypothetical protein [Mycolicibacterium parafortuitum]|uniref:Uncharacterized protein n=1 Tax=Mycolicibacterium parafortuitum TaxID=39692 RepID=A0A375YKC5_MYCPF|nr:hypothetical protein [Mycolicibacterium parafortuitum]ORB26625.1 hypothetical protein BST38_25515 [Mycolicibacterium parafortuitum]SRX81552.1 hypothetical protein MPP7335_03304 [Mycolicibacterium parafortuitum]
MATTPSDQLKYAAAILWQRAEWTTDAIAGSCCDDDHDIELDAITDAACEIRAMAEKLGDPRTYSDGRQVQTTREIEPGVYTVHVWHPDPSAEQPRSWRGSLRHDPDEQCPGVFEVTTTPETQEIHVRTVRLA